MSKPTYYLSVELQNAQTFEAVVKLINGGGTCEGMQGIEFTPEQIAGQYAWDAAKDAGYLDADSLRAHLDLLGSEGAEFDVDAALVHASKLVEAQA